MNKGVFSLICGCGGLFHGGISGRAEEELALAARGKLSVISGRSSGAALYKGVGFGGGGVATWSCFGTGSFSRRFVLKSSKLEANIETTTRAKMVCRNLP